MKITTILFTLSMVVGCGKCFSRFCVPNWIDICLTGNSIKCFVCLNCEHDYEASLLDCNEGFDACLKTRSGTIYTTIKTKIFATTNKVNTYYYYYLIFSNVWPRQNTAGLVMKGRGCVTSENSQTDAEMTGCWVLTKIECYCHSDGCNSAPRRNILSAVLIVTAVSAICLQFYISRMWWYTVKTMDNVRSHFAAFLAFKTKNQRHIIILLFETLQFWFKWEFL